MNKVEKLIALRNGQGHSAAFITARFEHTQERMRERYNMDLSREGWEEINYLLFIEDPEVCEWIDIGDSSLTSLYRLKWRNQQMVVPYSESAFVTMTILPRSDPRVIAQLQGRYEQKTLTTADTAYRDAKRRLAAEFDAMKEVGGHLVLANDVAPATHSDPRPANHALANGLTGFKPRVVPPVAAPTLPIAKADVLPPFDPEVVAAFGRLDAHLTNQEIAIEHSELEALEEIAALERRIATLRNDDVLATMKRQFIGSTRDMATDAFVKYRDGIFTSEAALGFARLLMAQQQMSAEPEPKPEVEPAAAVQLHRTARGLDGITDEGPDVVMIQNGKRWLYRLDGIEDSITGWATRMGVTSACINARMANGMSFRQAVTTGRLKSGRKAQN